jgi:hypothetical protein
MYHFDRGELGEHRYRPYWRKQPAVNNRIATIVGEWTPRLGLEVEAETLEATGSCSSSRGDTAREAAR